MLNVRVVSNDWPNEPDGKDWPLGRSFPLPCIAKELHHMAAQDWLSHAIPTDPDYPQPSVDDRNTVVDSTKVDRTQQDVLTPPANRHDDYHRCVDQRLGSSFFRNKGRGPVEQQRGHAAHQLLGIESCIAGNSIIFQRPSTDAKAFETAGGQLNSGGVHKQEWRNTFITANSIIRHVSHSYMIP